MCTRLYAVSIAVVLSRALTLTALAQEDVPDAGTVLVRINGEAITAGDVRFALMARRVPPERQEAYRVQLLEQLIDRRLMQDYLTRKKAQPDEALVRERIAQIKARIRAGGNDPHDVLGRLGYNPKRLHDAVALPLAWHAYFRRVTTDEQIREHFNAHRAEFDGTEVRARQIFLKLPSDVPADELAQTTESLTQTRKKILDGDLTFPQAAQMISQAPSARQGGDIGFFPYHGKMPLEFAKAAFPLKAGEISPPFRTRFGLHIVTVTQRRPGQLSLEDARTEIAAHMAADAWSGLVARLRKAATIERSDVSK